MAGPSVTAIVQIDDKASPYLEKIVQFLNEINERAKTSAEGMRTSIGEATKQMSADFREAAIAGKELFSAEQPQRMARAIGSVTTATKELEHSLERTHGILGEMLERMHSLPAIMAGAAMGHGAETVYEHASAERHAEYMNWLQGQTEAQTERAKKAAIDFGATTQGLSIESGQHMAGSAYAVMPEEEAEKTMPELFKLRSALRLSHANESEEQLDERLHSIIKASEGVGANKTQRDMETFVNRMVQAMNFDQTLIKAEDPLNMAKQGGTAVKELNDAGMRTAIMLLAEWGGDRTGTALAALQKYSAGSGFSNHGEALKDLEMLGLVDPKDVMTNKKGDPVGIKAMSDSLLRLQQMSADPLAFIQQQIDPAIDRAWDKMDPARKQASLDAFKKQYETDTAADPTTSLTGADGKEVDLNKMDAKQLFALSEIRRMFPNAVAARALGEIFIQQDTLQAKGAKIDKAADVDKTIEMSKRDPMAQMTALNTALGNFATIAGGPAMDLAAKGLNVLSTAIGSLNKMLADNPTLNKIAAGGIFGAGIVGSGIAIEGLYGLVTAGPKLSNAGDKLIAAAEMQMKGATRNGVPGNGSAPTAGISLSSMLMNGGLLFDAVTKMWGDNPKDFGDHLNRVQDSDKSANDWLKKNIPGLGWLFPDDPKPWFEQKPTGIAKQAPVEPLYKLDVADYERSRRAEEDYRRDPEAARGRAMMQRDAPKVTVSGDANLAANIAVTVGLDGKTTALLNRTISIPLNTGDQGKAPGDSLGNRMGPR